MKRGNLLHGLPDPADGEKFEDLVVLPGVRIERIASGGHASPGDFWYNQQYDEWVMMVFGHALVEEEGSGSPERLEQGDWWLIPAGKRHRVKETSVDAVWLAVHIG